MADYGLKVSRDGYSITTSTPEYLVFSSKYATVKIAKAGGGTATVPSSSNVTTTIRHDLGFIPVAMLFFEPTPGSGKWRFGGAYMDTDETRINPDIANTYVDNINMVFRFDNNTASQKLVKYYYYIFSDPI